MHFTANVKDFKTAMDHVQTAVKNRTSLPILQNVMVRSLDQDKIKFTAYDLMQMISFTIDAQNSGDIYSTVEFDKLHKLSSKYKDDQTIRIEFDQAQALVSCARSKGKLSTLPASEFPIPNELQDESKVTFEGKAVVEAIKKASSMTGQDDVRYYLNGVALDVKQDHMSVVATDGHRLIKIVVPCKSEIAEQKTIIIPNESIAGFIKCVEDKEVVIQVAPNFVRFSDDQVEFQTQLIEGRYPDYERVIPQTNDMDFTFIGKELKDAVSRASVFGDGKATPLKMVVSGGECNLAVSGTNNSQGNEIVNCVSSNSIEIGVNAKYVTDAVNKIESDEVTIWMKDSSTAMLIQDEDTVMVVMPMRL